MAMGCGPGEQVPDVARRDELNLLVREAYYGHPNHKRAQTDTRQCTWNGDGHTEPILELESSTTGIIEFASNHFSGQVSVEEGDALTNST